MPISIVSSQNPNHHVQAGGRLLVPTGGNGSYDYSTIGSLQVICSKKDKYSKSYTDYETNDGETIDACMQRLLDKLDAKCTKCLTKR